MKNKQIKGLLLINNDYVIMCQKITFKDTLQEIYKLLKCSNIEMPIRYINKKPYTFIVDGEGLLKEKPKITAISKDHKSEILVNNILIVSGETDKDGNILSLNDNDYNELLKALANSNGLLEYEFY